MNTEKKIILEGGHQEMEIVYNEKNQLKKFTFDCGDGSFMNGIDLEFEYNDEKLINVTFKTFPRAGYVFSSSGYDYKIKEVIKELKTIDLKYPFKINIEKDDDCKIQLLHQDALNELIDSFNNISIFQLDEQDGIEEFDNLYEDEKKYRTSIYYYNDILVFYRLLKQIKEGYVLNECFKLKINTQDIDYLKKEYNLQ